MPAAAEVFRHSSLSDGLKLHHQHTWDLSLAEARRLQERLREHVLVEPLSLDGIRSVAGVDASYRKPQAGEGGWVRAAVVEMDYPDLHIRAQAVGKTPMSFPYVPGLLSFRESPAILAALEQLLARKGQGNRALPDVLIFDGQGLAHPRRFGIACHIGVLLDIPTIGCAKSILVGEVGELGEDAGSVSNLVFAGEIIGAAVRTRKNVKPVYVSVGHKVDLESAVRLVLGCCRGHRLPEPARLAHTLANSPTVG